MTMRAADLTVIIVNWNTIELLDDCLTSVIDHAPADLCQEVVVVDNASSDGSLEHLRTRWPSVKLIANDENVGFCRANNQAIRESDGRYLLFVNTDAATQAPGASTRCSVTSSATR